ncbi:hypothetical protein SCYAM73S_02767 [Streptomyces cyaneofuscatus]
MVHTEVDGPAQDGEGGIAVAGRGVGHQCPAGRGNRIVPKPMRLTGRSPRVQRPDAVAVTVVVVPAELVEVMSE